MPPDASRQSRSVSNRPRASSQPSHAQLAVSEPGYRKHSLEEIPQTAGDASTKRVKSAVQVYNTPHDLGSCNHGDGELCSARMDYDWQIRMLQQQNKKRLMARQEEKESSAQNTWVSGPGITKETPNFLVQEVIRRSQDKPGEAGPSLDATSQAHVIENSRQKDSSLVRPVQSVSTHEQAEDSTLSEILSTSTEIIASQNALDRLNLDCKALSSLYTAMDYVKLRIDQGLDEIPTTLRNIQHLKNSLPAAEATLPKQQRDLLDKKRAEIKTLETKYEDLIAITSDAQKERLQKLKSETMSKLQKELDDIKGDDPISRKVQATKAQIETLERNLKGVKDRAPGLIEALKGLLEKLS